jgi:hypothetical protein
MSRAKSILRVVPILEPGPPTCSPSELPVKNSDPMHNIDTKSDFAMTRAVFNTSPNFDHALHDLRMRRFTVKYSPNWDVS